LGIQQEANRLAADVRERDGVGPRPFTSNTKPAGSLTGCAGHKP
jgi:hypothetical protein